MPAAPSIALKVQVGSHRFIQVIASSATVEQLSVAIKATLLRMYSEKLTDAVLLEFGGYDLDPSYTVDTVLSSGDAITLKSKPPTVSAMDQDSSSDEEEEEVMLESTPVTVLDDAEESSSSEEEVLAMSDSSSEEDDDDEEEEVAEVPLQQFRASVDATGAAKLGSRVAQELVSGGSEIMREDYLQVSPKAKAVESDDDLSNSSSSEDDDGDNQSESDSEEVEEDKTETMEVDSSSSDDDDGSNSGSESDSESESNDDSSDSDSTPVEEPEVVKKVVSAPVTPSKPTTTPVKVSTPKTPASPSAELALKAFKADQASRVSKIYTKAELEKLSQPYLDIVLSERKLMKKGNKPARVLRVLESQQLEQALVTPADLSEETLRRLHPGQILKLLVSMGLPKNSSKGGKVERILEAQNKRVLPRAGVVEASVVATPTQQPKVVEVAQVTPVTAAEKPVEVASVSKEVTTKSSTTSSSKDHTQEELQAMSKNQLAGLCVASGLPKGGPRADKVARLLEHQKKREQFKQSQGEFTEELLMVMDKNDLDGLVDECGLHLSKKRSVRDKVAALLVFQGIESDAPSVVTPETVAPAVVPSTPEANKSRSILQSMIEDDVVVTDSPMRELQNKAPATYASGVQARKDTESTPITKNKKRKSDKSKSAKNKKQHKVQAV